MLPNGVALSIWQKAKQYSKDTGTFQKGHHELARTWFFGCIFQTTEFLRTLIPSVFPLASARHEPRKPRVGSVIC